MTTAVLSLWDKYTLSIYSNRTKGVYTWSMGRSEAWLSVTCSTEKTSGQSEGPSQCRSERWRKTLNNWKTKGSGLCSYIFIYLSFIVWHPVRLSCLGSVTARTDTFQGLTVLFVFSSEGDAHCKIVFVKPTVTVVSKPELLCDLNHLFLTVVGMIKAL